MRKSLLIFSILSSISAHSQNPDLNSFYWNTYSIVNPAYSGLSDRTLINFQIRNDFEYQGLPEIGTIIAETMVKKLHGAIGMNYNQYHTDYNRSKTIKVNYNYQFELRKSHRLSGGIALGIDHWRTYQEQFSVASQGRYFVWMPSPTYDHEFSDLNVTAFVMCAGLAYQFKKLKVGASVTNHIDGNQIESSNDSTFTKTYSWVVYNSSYHHYFADYQFKVFKWMDMKPLLAANFQKDSLVEAMCNLNFVIKENFLFGFQLNIDDLLQFSEASLLFGVQIAQKFQLNYAFGNAVCRYTNESWTAHEFGLAYVIR